MSRNLSILLSVLVFVSCSEVDDYFLSGSDVPQARELYTLVASETDHAVRAVATERLAGHLLVDHGPHALNAYLTTFVERNPDDEYGALYLSIVAQNYLDQGARDLARYYFERVITGYPDVVVRGTSLRKQALEQIVRLSDSPAERASYYQMLLDEYDSSVDRGLIHYRLGQNFEELGEWERAFEAYRAFLQYPNAVVPGEPNAHRDVTDRINFYDSSKDWTVATLEELRRGITAALLNKNASALLNYQANVNFFTRSWEQDFDDPNVSGFWGIGEILRLTRSLEVGQSVSIDDDGDEAYLYTYGWGGLRIRTWYLYFRKVDFPADPEIHGTWEWAGVYLGERL
ncbi:MAG: tetratricopeptide repeat protein [Spirochaetales bacterium]